MSDERETTEVFSKIVDLAAANGVEAINKLPGCWEHVVDGRWIIAVNGHDHPVKSHPDGTMGCTVPPYELAVWYNGWLAGLVSPFGGVIAAGENANEDTLIAALDVAISKAQSKLPADRIP